MIFKSIHQFHSKISPFFWVFNGKQTKNDSLFCHLFFYPLFGSVFFSLLLININFDHIFRAMLADDCPNKDGNNCDRFGQFKTFK